MPRIQGINLRQLIRTELRNGTNRNVILEQVRQLSPNPQSWDMRTIHNLAYQIGVDETPHVSLNRRRAPRRRPTEAWDILGSPGIQQILNTIPETPVTPSWEIDDTHSWGIEIEFLRPSSLTQDQIAHKLTQAGIRCHSEGYHKQRRTYWKIVNDSTVCATGSAFSGCNELVSPPLKGEEGINQVKKVCELLKEMNIKVNLTCGLHVHHELPEHGTLTAKIARNAICLYDKYQSKFNAMLPRSRRNCRYARSFECNEIQSLHSTSMRLWQSNNDRYKVVNIHAYWRHGTLEFRQHSGTVDGDKILHWVSLTQKIMNKARSLASRRVSIWNHAYSSFEIELGITPHQKMYIEERVRHFTTGVAA